MGWVLTEGVIYIFLTSVKRGISSAAFQVVCRTSCSHEFEVVSHITLGKKGVPCCSESEYVLGPAT